jgi:hypothetical protein
MPVVLSGYFGVNTGGSLWILWCLTPSNTYRHDIAAILLEETSATHTSLLFVTGPGALSRLTPLSVGLLLLPCTLMDILFLFTRFCSWKQVTGHDPFVAQVGKQTLMMKTVT